MAPQRRANCQICKETESKYACPKCEVLYCSVSCFKEHKSFSCSASASADSGTNTSILPTSNASADEKSTSIENPRIGSIPASEHDGRRRQPSLLASDGDGDGANASSLQSQSQSTSEFRSSARNSGASPSTSMILASHARRGEPQSTSAGDIDNDAAAMGDPKVEEEKNDTLEVLPQTEVEGGSTDRTGGVSTRPTSGPEPESSPARETSLDRSSSLPPPPSRPLRKLSSLKWPYVPDMPSHPDPLTRDDPKPLNLLQYEAIARSPAVRHVLSSQSRLPTLLRSLDTLRGDARERAIERVLGVAPDQASFSLAGLPPSSDLNFNLHGYSSFVRGRGKEGLSEVDEDDMRALRELAEAVEAAVRGVGNSGTGFGADPLGLDWEGMET